MCCCYSNGRWLKSRESNSSTTGSMIGGEHFYYNQGHVSSEAGITAGLRRKYTLSADYKVT